MMTKLGLATPPKKKAKENPETTKVLSCCRSYPGEKLDIRTISVLTGLPKDEVSKNLDSLRKKNKLPKQYLIHLLN